MTTDRLFSVLGMVLIIAAGIMAFALFSLGLDGWGWVMIAGILIGLFALWMNTRPKHSSFKSPKKLDWKEKGKQGFMEVVSKIENPERPKRKTILDFFNTYTEGDPQY